MNSVLICGAGPTGLVMAIELKRFAIPFRLIDKSDHPAQYSQALVVQARTLEQFERYGIAGTAVEQGRKIHGASMVSDGKPIVSFAFDRIPGRYPYVLFLPQNDTERILMDHLQSLDGTVERGVELISLEQREDGVGFELLHPDGHIEKGSSRWLIGCDGAHSAVRKSLKVPFIGDTVGLSFLLADLELEGPDVPGDELRIYLHHGDVAFIGRLKANLHRVIVVLHSEQSELANRKPELADFQRALDRAGARITAISADWMTPFHINQRKAEHYRTGDVFLAGDASHIHSPVAGQGMNTGIQDAANLAWKLAAVEGGADSRLLDSYDEERGAVGEALLRTTSRGLAAATSSNRIFQTIRNTLFSTFSHLPQVQNALVGFVSETAIEYRGSSIVMDCGGEGPLRAGDRVPNPDGILDPLQEAKPLILAINVADPGALKAKAPKANLTALKSGTLGERERILIVRPDGYLGFRGGAGDAENLNRYLALTS